jgi:hypothetical protein
VYGKELANLSSPPPASTFFALISFIPVHLLFSPLESTRFGCSNYYTRFSLYSEACLVVSLERGNSAATIVIRRCKPWLLTLCIYRCDCRFEWLTVTRTSSKTRFRVPVFWFQLHQRFYNRGRICVQFSLCLYTRQNVLLTENKLHETEARSELSPRKSMARLAQHELASTATAWRAAKMLRLKQLKKANTREYYVFVTFFLTQSFRVFTEEA